MKISTEITPDRQAVVTVEVDETQLESALRRAASSVSRVRPVPGFRPGKAPYELVQRMFGRELLMDEAVDELSRSLYPKVLKDADLKPVDVGSLKVVQKEPPILQYTIPVQPVVKLGDYKSLHLVPREIVVSDDEVNAVLEQFQAAHATVSPVSRPVQKGDVITVDLTGGVSGAEPLEQKNLRVTIGGDGRMRLPFDEQIIGMAAGETRTIEFTYPDDYAEEQLRGRTAIFTVTVSDIKETQLPELTDEFAKAVSQFSSLDQLKGSIRDVLRRRKEQEEEVRFANEVLKTITDQAEIAFPPVLLEREIDHDVDEFKREVTRAGLTWDNYLRLTGKSEAEVRQSFREHAESRLRQLLVLGELMRAEEVTVTREEVNAEIEARVKRIVEMGGNPNAARRQYSSKDARESIEYNLRVGKVMNKMIAMVRGEPVSGKILTPEMLVGEGHPIPTGLITDPSQVREEEWPRGVQTG